MTKTALTVADIYVREGIALPAELEPAPGSLVPWYEDAQPDLVRPYALTAPGLTPTAGTCDTCGGSGLKDYGDGVTGCRDCHGWGDPDGPTRSARQPYTMKGTLH